MTQNRWKIDRKVSATIMLAMVMQFASILIWATDLDARVSHMEKNSLDGGVFNEKFARLDERLDSVRQQLELLSRQIDKITDRIFQR